MKLKSVGSNRLIAPFQGALIHLVLIGIPTRFGLYYISPFQNLFGMYSPCSMYGDYNGTCSPLEKFFIRDLGYRFGLHFELAIVACFIMKGGDNSNLELRRLHKTLIATSFLTILGMAWLQRFGGSAIEFEADFFAFHVFNYLLAIAVSVWVSKPTTIPVSKKPASWSAPGTALLAAATVNAMAAIASAQVLMSTDGIFPYIDMSARDEITPVVTTTCLLATMHSVLHVMTLMSLRDAMTLEQLRMVCAYKVVVHLALPFLWMPEASKLLHIHPGLVIGLRVMLTVCYLYGYLFAGKADNVGKIMRSEKDA